MKFFTQILIVAALISAVLCECPFTWKPSWAPAGEESCQMPVRYGRGDGYEWKIGDSMNLKGARKRCEKAHPELGCEQSGAVIYPKCKEGFRNDACCICTPYCPSGWKLVDTVPHGYCERKL